jgi:hypothetical protein
MRACQSRAMRVEFVRQVRPCVRCGQLLRTRRYYDLNAKRSHFRGHRGPYTSPSTSIDRKQALCRDQTSRSEVNTSLDSKKSSHMAPGPEKMDSSIICWVRHVLDYYLHTIQGECTNRASHSSLLYGGRRDKDKEATLPPSSFAALSRDAARVQPCLSV